MMGSSASTASTASTYYSTGISAVAFLLRGRVQKVKMRRYVESAARHFGVGGYVINTENENDNGNGGGGDVFGEAWLVTNHADDAGGNADDDADADDCSQKSSSLLDDFTRWIRGEWEPAVFTNVKPTPIGTAYPEKAVVDKCVLLLHWKQEGGARNNIWKDPRIQQQQPQQQATMKELFVMVRDDQEAALIALERKDILEKLLLVANNKTAEDNASASIREEAITISAWPQR